MATGDSLTAIATILVRSRTTIYTELKHESVVQTRQDKARLVYLAGSGQLTYEQQRLGSFNTMKLSSIESFIFWVKEKVFKNIGLLMLLSDMLNVNIYLHIMK
nr:helix-turn-helix domain-containing protein [Veillonella rodentium]